MRGERGEVGGGCKLMGRDEGWGMYGWGIGLMHEEWENSETCDEI